jgi:2-polyprenyl-6-methoxyphenol hydroxylase-like FAD-dependent oxidoreductase
VRPLALPESPDPSESEFGVWRCIAPRPKDLGEKIMMIAPGLRLGIMPISEAELYLFGIVREGVGTRFEPDAWPELMRERFARFGGWAPALLESATSFHYAVIETVDARQPWSNGGVLLIGDAAHAMTPFMGQGASMAIEDSVVLAELLGAAPSATFSGPVRANLFRQFEQRRRPRVHLVQEHSLAAGRSWGSDAAAFSPTSLKETMQMRVDDLYEVLAAPP